MVNIVQQGSDYAVGPLIDAYVVNGDGTTTAVKIVAPGFVQLDSSGNPVNGGGEVYGPDATGAPPTKPAVLVAGIDGSGNVQPIGLGAGNHIQTASEQAQGQPVGVYGTVIVGIADDDTSALPFVVDTDGYLYARTMGNMFWNESSTPLAGSGSFSGPSRDSGSAGGAKGLYSYFSAFVAADQGGTARIDGSNDNVSWYTVATEAVLADTPLTLQVPVMTRYHRVAVVNGAVAQTTLQVNSSYSAA